MSYFDNVNLSVLDHVPLDAARIAEIGCGAGGMARAVRARGRVGYYVGIDIHQDQLDKAATWLDQGICADLNQHVDWAVSEDLKHLLNSDFDCWIAGDVLEHLVFPEHALAAIYKSLKPGGTLVVCVPNVRNWQTFLHLIRGRWPREEEGLFDRTHLRWFTCSDMLQLLHQCQFQVAKSFSRQFPDPYGEEILEFLEPLCDFLQVDFDALLQDGMALQHVFVARKPL